MYLFIIDTVIKINESRNYKSQVDACCNKLLALLMRANELNINTKMPLYFIFR